jgi:putative acetyltransferase
MHIRPATNRDADAVRQLVFGVLEEYGLSPDPDGTDADLVDIEANYQRPGGLFDVVEGDDGHIVGSVGLMPMEAGDRRVCELRKMYLVPGVRGRGLGKRLLERVLDRARQLGFVRVELETATPLVEAIGLYRRYGFRPFEKADVTCRCDQAYFLELRPGAHKDANHAEENGT